VTPALVISISGVLIALLCAVGGALWRLSSSVTAAKLEMKVAAENATKSFDDVIAMFRDFEAFRDETRAAMAGLHNQWATAHRLVAAVTDLQYEVRLIKTICEERRARAGASLRINRDNSDEDTGVVESVEPVGCPLDDDGGKL